MADLKELRIADDLIVSGNLKVTGEQIVTSTSDTTIKDNTITLNKGASSLPAAGSGVEIESNGSIVGSLVYKSSGWDFGGANLTNTGNISADFVGLNDTPANYSGAAGKYLKINSGANAVEFISIDTDQVPQGSTNLYYTDTRADARITNAGVTSSTVSNWNSAYGWGDHSGAGYLTAIVADSIDNTMIDFGTTGNKVNTDNLPQGSTNLYYNQTTTYADADTRIAASSIKALSDVNSGATPTDGQVLVWNQSSGYYTPGAPASAVVNLRDSGTTSGTVSSISTAYDGAKKLATISSFSLDTASNTKVQINFAIEVVQETPNNATIGIFRAINGNAMTYGSPIAEYSSPSANNHFAFTLYDSVTANSVEYQVVPKFDSGSTNTYQFSNMSFTAIEHIELSGLLKDVQTSSLASGNYLKYNGSNWVNETPSISNNSDVQVSGPNANHVLVYSSGNSRFENQDPNTLAQQINFYSLQGVTQPSASDDQKLLKYNHGTSSFVWTAGIDVITEVVDDTTPQLGGNLDVNGNSIISTGGADINITPDTGGRVVIATDLVVQGTATTLEVNNVEVEDPVMLLNKHSSQPANNSTDAGLIVQRGSSENNAAWIWEEGTDRWVAATTTSTASDTNITITANADVQAGTVYATATTAQYADLAEIYEADDNYEPGTVVVFGGEKEVTTTSILADHRVAGVVSTNPAYLMNKDANGVAVALRGKVPCKVEGVIKKGDVLVSNAKRGTATALAPESANPPAWCIVGKSLENSTDTGIKVINIVV
tara:strand:+ start:191 stop:2509 length:2319 start_codon:yes stop_codon:yes gene_type:complete